jgi:hypothetical protein
MPTLSRDRIIWALSVFEPLKKALDGLTCYHTGFAEDFVGFVDGSDLGAWF